jgi:hypothetical protein
VGRFRPGTTQKTSFRTVNAGESRRPEREKGATPCDPHTSPPVHALRRYAESHTDSWYVRSTEHGLLRPDEDVAPFERTLDPMRRAERHRRADRVQKQLLDVLPANAELIALAGERYRENLIPFLEKHGHRE